MFGQFERKIVCNKHYINPKFLLITNNFISVKCTSCNVRIKFSTSSSLYEEKKLQSKDQFEALQQSLGISR